MLWRRPYRRGRVSDLVSCLVSEYTGRSGQISIAVRAADGGTGVGGARMGGQEQHRRSRPRERRSGDPHRASVSYANPAALRAHCCSKLAAAGQWNAMQRLC